MYKSKSTVIMAVLSSLLLSAPAAFTQNAGGAGSQARGGTDSGARLQDRDRLTTPDADRLHDRSLDQTQDRLHDRTLDRTQDRLHDRLMDHLYERDLLRERDRDRIYGGSLMSATEQADYEQHLRSLATEEQRVQFRLGHQHDMQVRAEERHQRLGPALTEAQIRAQEREQIYGYSMMTPEEVARYQAQIGAARTEQEREHVRAEHRTQMEERARERGESSQQ